jgi:hypothetical protein
MFAILFLALASTFFIFSAPAGAATINVNCPPDNLQTALDNAQPGDTILITGTCTGNFLVRNDKVRVFIDGNNFAGTIDGGGSGTTLDIRGKAISVTKLTVTGGSNGIQIQRGSNAVIDDVTVENSTGTGITVTSVAFAVIINSRVRNHDSNGISITENSDARIGFNTNANGTASPNEIHNNGSRGIIVFRSSSARITSNNIHDNADDGIAASRSSHVDASNNILNNNGGSGISISENSAAQLGEETSTLFALPNSTTTNNAVNGIRCRLGGSLDGIIGTLNGTLMQTDISANCPNSLVP